MEVLSTFSRNYEYPLSFLNLSNKLCATQFSLVWPSNSVWYDHKPLGINKLDNMMKEISQAAQLSRFYTNHLVRSTAITLWSNAGVPNRHIMAISGHRNEQSLAHYNTRPSTAQLLCALQRSPFQPHSRGSPTLFA